MPATNINKGFVLDVSACMPWCCEDEATVESENLLRMAAGSHILHVPSIWPWEMMNAVAVSVRRRSITEQRAALLFEQLSSFEFRVAPGPALAEFARISALASSHRLTAYDAAYLDLAKRMYLPLATLDGDLKAAAVAEGLGVL